MSKPNSDKKDPKVSKAAALFAKASNQWDRGKVRSAFRLFLTGAKRGDPSAQHNLGYFYDVGVGVKPNRAAALYWYKRAFRRGYRTAASNIGTIFRDEEKTKQALSWFQRAIRLGDADANLEVAKIYLRVEGQVEKAIVYLKRTTKARPSDVTEASRQEAQRLLKQIVRKRVQANGPKSARFPSSLRNRRSGRWDGRGENPGEIRGRGKSGGKSGDRRDVPHFFTPRAGGPGF
jgi:TPR repeat protein